MPNPTDTLNFRQALLQLLEAAPGAEDRLLAGLEDSGHDQPLYSSILYLLTHLNFSESEAQRHWRQIRAHRDQLKSELKRDPGLRVALLDYFVNVNRELKNPKVIEISIYQRTERDAVTDGLTGLYNHSYFLQALKRELQRARRHELKLSLLMFDLDDFKRINDTRGHVEGDRVLVKTAALIKESLREIDIAARYGGEEFAVILPEAPRTGAQLVAERIRLRIESHYAKRRGAGVTISGGVASFPDDATGAEDLLRRADEGLYRSKAAGKNRVTMIGRERRRHQRKPLDQSATLKSANRRLPGARVRNVSESGLLVSLKSPVPVGSQVSLVLRPAKGAPMGLRGEVVRVDAVAGPRSTHYDVGVRLLGTSDQTQALVLRRVEAPSRE